MSLNWIANWYDMPVNQSYDVIDDVITMWSAGSQHCPASFSWLQHKEKQTLPIPPNNNKTSCKLLRYKSTYAQTLMPTNPNLYSQYTCS